MSTINCDVINCSYNDSGLCYSNQLSINGKKSLNSSHTHCASFLDEVEYRNLTNSTNSDGPCSIILCNVKTCAHNIGNSCYLNNISVTSENAKVNFYSETYCFNFNSK